MAVLTTAPYLPRPRRAAPSAVKTAPLVSVIIVNYRRWEETAALVAQLLDREHIYRDRIEVFVVDNASEPHPLADEIQRKSGVKFIRLEQNRGFSAGVNAGFRQSRGRWVLVLNPDLIACRGFVDLICGAAVDLDDERWDDDPIGVVGFQLRNRDGTYQLSTGFFPTVGQMLLGLLRSRPRRKYLAVPANERQSVPWVTGSCVLVRRECLQQLGGFDEEFFLYYEDVDLCRRTREKGWSVCYEPTVQVVHLDPLQNRPVTVPMWAITRHASLTYFRKHLSGWQFWSLAQIIRAESWLRQRFAWLFGHKDKAQICQHVRGICRDLRRNKPKAARERLEQVLRQVGMSS